MPSSELAETDRLCFVGGDCYTGLAPRYYNIPGRSQVYKWKNHFSEMKGNVGMSLHEKAGEQEDA